jgi:DNA-binding transcriptional LysR family regulator
MFGETIVPGAISELHRLYPGVAFQLVTGHPNVDFSRLPGGELDMTFGWLPRADEMPDYLTSRPMVDLVSRVIADERHPLVKQATVSAGDLAQYPWVVLEHDRERIKAALEHCRDTA